ncbi:MAG TPA: EVE domain-containing protein [Polyangia bacterium]|nr:EVE domain-containing protein [Polyangia bacterium]
MAHWLLKTEPSTYSFDTLEKEGRAVWDGVTNPVALRNLKQAAVGDQIVVYHTGDERAAVGWAEVVGAAYPDPKAQDPRLVVIDIAPRGRLKNPVNLATLKAHPGFRESPLVRQGRLSVVPLSAEQWAELKRLAGG